jgi:radical SAM superfamily enzyme YgiQ (UPF0313 family)
MPNAPRKILMVYPPIPSDTYWSFSHALALIHKKCAMPPLGLLTVAGMLPPGTQLKLVDMNFQPLRATDIAWADMVFVSGMLIQKKALLGVMRQCREAGTPVVAGGPYPSTAPEELSEADHILCGEAEGLVPLFLADYARGRARRVYEPLPPPDLGHSPLPRFDLLDLRAYGSMAIQYSRGCPFHCEFCDIWRRFGNRPRLKSATQAIGELEELYRLGWRGPVFIVDDNFIGNRQRVKTEFLPALSRWQQRRGNPFRFYTEGSIDLARDDELMAAMVAAGFHEIFVGIETPSPRALAETGKHQNLKGDLEASVRRIQGSGLEVMGGFIVGFDSDDEDIFDQQLAFIQRNAIPQAMVGLLTALPGTRLFERLQEEGRLCASASGNNTHVFNTNFLPRMGTAPLKAGYRRLLNELYGNDLRDYFQRCDKLLDRLGKRRLSSRVAVWRDGLFLVRSLLRQPFTPYGWQYLKFLLRNLPGHAGRFSQAVKYGIVGHHYHRITRQLLEIDQLSVSLDRTYERLRSQLHCGNTPSENAPALPESVVIAAWRWSQAVLADARRRIERLHGDCRDDLLHQYEVVAGKVRNLFQPFSGQLDRGGVRFR